MQDKLAKLNIEPIISVIVPVYNSSSFLCNCLDSIKNQTIRDIEIICVDDGSTDDSLEILYQYSESDNRFRIITQNNSHAGVARNNGLNAARGKYVAFFDSDDEYALDCLEKFLDLCEANDLDFVKGTFYRMNAEDGIMFKDSFTMMQNLQPHYEVLSFQNNPDTIIHIPDVPWNALYKKEYLDKNNIRFNDLEVSNDHSFFVECAVHSQRVMITDVFTAVHRVGQPSSLVGRKADKFSCQLDSHRIVEKKVDFLAPEYKKIVLTREFDHTIFWYYKLLRVANENQKESITKQMKEFLKTFDIKTVGYFEYIKILVKRKLIYITNQDIKKAAKKNKVVSSLDTPQEDSMFEAVSQEDSMSEAVSQEDSMLEATLQEDSKLDKVQEKKVQSVMLEDVSICYKVGDFKDIGIKEFVIRKIKHDYNVESFWADRNITFDLEPGDMLGIIGRNGAGKSTLLKAICRIIHPKEGKVKTKGKIVALIELSSGFDSDLTVKENTYLRGAMMGYTKELLDEMYDQIIEFADLQGFEDRPFKQLSSGMKSKLAFSIACHVNPDILILDEVLSVGDGAFRIKAEEKIKEIISGGATAILVSHSIAQVRQLCNKVLWLDNGKQVAFTDKVGTCCNEYEESLRNIK